MVPRRAPENAKSSASGTTPARAPISRWIASIRVAPSSRAVFSARSSMLITSENSCMGQHDVLGAEHVVGPHLWADRLRRDAVRLELAQHDGGQGVHAFAHDGTEAHAHLAALELQRSDADGDDRHVRQVAV